MSTARADACTAKFSVAVRGYTDEDADMLCLDLFIDFVRRHLLLTTKLCWLC